MKTKMLTILSALAVWSAWCADVETNLFGDAFVAIAKSAAPGYVAKANRAVFDPLLKENVPGGRAARKYLVRWTGEGRVRAKAEADGSFAGRFEVMPGPGVEAFSICDDGKSNGVMRVYRKGGVYSISPSSLDRSAGTWCVASVNFGDAGFTGEAPSPTFELAQPDKGYVTFVIDDNRADLGQIFGIFQEYGFPLCAAVPVWTVSAPAYLLKSIEAAGGEVMCHTMTHDGRVNRWSSHQEIESEFAESKARLTALGFAGDTVILAGGGGMDRGEDFLRHIEGMVSRYFPLSDLYGTTTQHNLARTWITGLDTGWRPIRRYVDESVREKKWNRFLFHETAEVGGTSGLYEILDYMKKFVDEGKLEVVTYRQYVQRFGTWSSVANSAAKLSAPKAVVPVRAKGPRTYWISESGSDENDGLTAKTPIRTTQKAALLTGKDDVTFKVLGAYRMDGNTALLPYSGRMKFVSGDEKASLSRGQWRVFAGGDLVIDDIAYSLGMTNAPYFACGNRIEIGPNARNLNERAAAIVLCGNGGRLFALQPLQRMGATVRSSTAGVYICADDGVSQEIKVTRDVVIDCAGTATVPIVRLNGGGNQVKDWRKRQPLTFEGNVFVNAREAARIGEVELPPFGEASGSYSNYYKGCVQVLLNASSSDTVLRGLGQLPSNLVYVVRAGEGGEVGAVEKDGRRMPGRVRVTFAAGTRAAVLVNAGRTTRLPQAGIYPIEPGETVISFEGAWATDAAKSEPREMPRPELVWKDGEMGEGNVLTVVAEKRSGVIRAAKSWIDLTPYVGRVLELSIDAEGENVSVPAASWNGMKVMLVYRNPVTGKDSYPGAGGKTGTFPRQTFTLNVDLTDIPAGKRTTGYLFLGLQDSTGKLRFFTDSIRVRTKASVFPLFNAEGEARYSDGIARLPPHRGVMLPAGDSTEDDFRTLKSWGATLVRYQMVRGWTKTDDNRDLAEFDRWLDGRLDHLERVLSWARQYGLKVVVDLHVPPGGKAKNRQFNMFTEKKYADHFVACWRRIATRFRARKEIFGFDLINEPVQNDPNAPFDYWNLQFRAARAIREIDGSTPIIMASNGGDTPDAFRYLTPMPLTDVIYQVHVYDPIGYTHQGVLTPRRKPGEYEGYPSDKWNIETIRRALKPVRDFQQRYHARIYAGEFSAIAWAPGAERYLQDCIRLFEEYGWDWSYHAFREWEGWSVEHEFGADGKFRKSETPRRRVLVDGFHGKTDTPIAAVRKE